MSPGYLIIVALFLLYYFMIIILERKLIKDAGEIIEKFLEIALLYVGISIIYFSITGKPFLDDSIETYNVYIFLIGFIAIVWTIPSLLSDFSAFNKFFKPRGKTKK